MLDAEYSRTNRNLPSIISPKVAQRTAFKERKHTLELNSQESGLVSVATGWRHNNLCLKSPLDSDINQTERKSFKIKNNSVVGQTSPIAIKSNTALDQNDSKPVGIPNYEGMISIKKIATPQLVSKMKQEKKLQI